MGRADNVLQAQAIRIDAGSPGDTHIQGEGRAGEADAFLVGIFPSRTTGPAIRYNDITAQWELRNSGGTYSPIATTLRQTYLNGTGSDNTIPINSTQGPVILDIPTGGDDISLLRLSSEAATEAALVVDAGGADLAALFPDGDLALGAGGMSGTEKLRVVGDARIEGKLTVTGLIDPTGLVLDEQSSAPAPSTAGRAVIWVEDTTPQTLRFTDDGGTTQVIVTGVGGAQVVVESAGTLPAAGTIGRLFFLTTDGNLYVDDGTSWNNVSTGASADPIFSCAASVALRDAVYVSGADTVDRANASAIGTARVLGIVTEKPTATTCRVARQGLASGFTGLTPGDVLFLDTSDGQVTDAPPSGTGEVIIRIGNVTDTGDVLLDIGDIPVIVA